jgi:HD-like signal output (HDOD) protein/ActR/RegA family two-component response regulator
VKSILFVDDEQRLLDGLQRMLRPQRKLWDMAFVSSGNQALELLDSRQFDVIVTDMRMPEMDGARLLELVKQRHPGVVRIVLSGYFETEAALRTVTVAHRFLAKPCNPDELREAIEHSCFFSGLLPDETIRRVTGAVGNLPSLPRTSGQLVDAMQKPDVALETISRIVEQDVGMTAKVLQLVNSAFFCIPRDITSVSAAVSYLGLDVLRQLVVFVEVFREFRSTKSVTGFSLADFQEHSRLSAGIAARLPAPKAVSRDAVMAAMLHDCGRLVLVSRLPVEFEAALLKSAERDLPLHEVEEEALGTTHAAIGAYLLGLWGLPRTVVDAVWRHHQPTSDGCTKGVLSTAGTVHIADALALEVATRMSGASAGAQNRLLNVNYVSDLRLEDSIEGWRVLAQEVWQLQSQ